MRCLFLFAFLCFFVIFIESKICPKCKIPEFLIKPRPIYNASNKLLNVEKCLYPKNVNISQKLFDISKLPTPVCVYIIPLRDDFLEFYFPTLNDSYFETFWKENGERCLKYFDNEVLGFYNFEKYGNLPTDILFTCTRGFKDDFFEEREDQLNIFLSNLTLAFIQEMEGKPSHQIKRCYDRDTDLVNSHWTLVNCMFAVMNRTFSIGPLSFNSFFVEEVGKEAADFTHLQNTFLSAQAKQEGCAIAQLNAASGKIEVLQSTANNKYLGDGECTGTLNLYGFDLLCCCYANVGNCLYTASPSQFNPETNEFYEDVQLKDDQFLCIKGFLNSTLQELKFRGPRNGILTDLSSHCYTILNITYDKDYVFNVSLTFGAALDADKSICNETSNDTNSGQYIKSPWGFHYEYDVTKDPIEIVRCCKGNFCNHFGMFDSESAYAWPKKFQYKMNEDWTMRCGYVPVDIFWNIFAPKNQSQECMRAISEEKTSEIQSSLGGRDFVIHPLYIAIEKDNANFTGILPNNAEPTFCFYAGISSSNAMNQSNIFYVPRMVFGCQINQTFTLPFDPTPNFNTEINLYQQNVLRELKKQYNPNSQCLTTNGQSLELLAFLRTTNEEKLLWFPVCFAMIYRDFHQTFYRSGPCTVDESCCLSDNWHNDYFNLSNHRYNEETKRYEGTPFAFVHKHQYKCNSQRCLSEKTQARCLYYAGASAVAAGIVSFLNDDELLKNEIYSPNMEEALVSLTVKEILGYNETSFKEIDRNQETTSIDISCAADDLCFTPGSLFTKAGMSSAFPFCVWSPQRQFGADFSRETIVADASNKPDRIRFEITSTFDFGDSVRFKDESDNDNFESLQKEDNQKQYYPKHAGKNRNVLRHEF